MKSLVSLLLLMAFSASLLAGCRPDTVTADDVMADLLSKAGAIPAGTLFSSSASPYGSAPHLDDSLVASLFSREDGYCEYAACVESCAVYLGALGENYCEVGVFVCYGSADTEAVAAMCLRRARLVRRGLSLPSEQIRVSVHGRTVILAMAADAACAARLSSAAE